MAAKELPSQDVLRQLLDYNPDTGAFTWRARQVGSFHSKKVADTWNASFAGKPALQGMVGEGYFGGTVCGIKAKAHRVAWKYMTGEDPDFIDHIDGNRKNNRYCNLRSVTKKENHRNQRRPNNNTSGECGVYIHHDGRWRAAIKVDQKKLHLGLFDSFEKAVEARRMANIKYGFHENHGR